MSISDTVRSGANIKNAHKSDPLLGSREGNARRKMVLEQAGAELARRSGPAYAHVIDLVREMRPSSVAEAWDGLYFELVRLEEAALAEAVARECQQARAEAWGSMASDADVISQVIPMGEQFLSSHASSVNRYRQKVSTMAGLSRPFRLGRAMEDHVVNMARFGSMADDWMTRVVIEELYLERGMYEEAMAICARILRFRGYDRHRMMASTLVEDVLNSLLGHLERFGNPGYMDHLVRMGMPVLPGCRDKKHLEALKQKCLALLERRARGLGLKIVPDQSENSLLRKASDYALKVRARRTIHGADEIVAYIRENYPESHEFLGLDRARTARRMADASVPLVENVSVQIELGHIARIRNAEPPTNNALEALEPMLAFIKGNKIGIKPKTLKKWREGMLGDQLWEFVFEMDVYLRLVRAGAGVEVDVGVPKAGGGNAEVDLEVDGCLAEVYSPLDKEILVYSHATRIESPGDAMVDYVLEKPQMRHVGEKMATVIVNCPGGEFGNLEVVRSKMESRLARAAQPGAVFFVKDGGSPRRVECLVNRNAAAAIPGATLQKIQGALEMGAL